LELLLASGFHSSISGHFNSTLISRPVILLLAERIH
jgi:hypothetical protein